MRLTCASNSTCEEKLARTSKHPVSRSLVRWFLLLLVLVLLSTLALDLAGLGCDLLGPALLVVLVLFSQVGSLGRLVRLRDGELAQELVPPRLASADDDYTHVQVSVDRQATGNGTHHLHLG